MSRKPFNSIVVGAILIPIGLVLFVAVATYSHARIWTDLWEGLLNGLVHSVLYSAGYLVIFVPMICLLLFATRKRPVSIWARSMLCLVPLLVMCGYAVFDWMANPITDRDCFESTMGFEMPISATNIQSERFGGGLTDISDSYYFTADVDEIRQMLTEKPFELTGEEPFEMPTGWPDPKSWDGVKSYEYSDETWYYSIHTDEDCTRAIVCASCI